MDSNQENNKFNHKTQLTTGILLTNLGTPDSPTAGALRRYLAEFLWDPRIVDMPRPLWWLLLQVILLIRPHRSASAYKKVWTDEGSPLLSISRNQKAAVERSLASLFTGPVVVELGMRYGNPSIASALENLRQAHAHRVLVLPLYPQYSCSTTASTFDAIAQTVKQWRWVPEFRFVNSYHDYSPYIEALANSIKESWEEKGQAQMLLFSFHGTPMRFLHSGDPYHCMCQATARLVAERLGLVESRWQVTFQSIFGREKWLQPYTMSTLETLAHSGVSSVDVVCPGFSADCLETLEEIQVENREAFLKAGGKKFTYIAALNDRTDHVHALCDLIRRHTLGWLDSAERWDEQMHQQENNDRAERAIALGADQ